MYLYSLVIPYPKRSISKGVLLLSKFTLQVKGCHRRGTDQVQVDLLQYLLRIVLGMAWK